MHTHTRTKAGLILEKILHKNPHRYVFCWDGEDGHGCYDCACCMTWCDDELYARCGCICHERIEEMAHAPHMNLWLVAMEAMDELPRFFTSYDDKLAYCREIAANHEAQRREWANSKRARLEYRPCDCTHCEFVREHDKNNPAEPVGLQLSITPHEHVYSCPYDEQQCDGECRATHTCVMCSKTRKEVEDSQPDGFNG